MNNTMDNLKELQLNFFQKIKETLPPNASLVNEVADILNINSDSAYRRIRGEKSLDLDEIFNLSNKFNLSIDELFNTKTQGDSLLCRVIDANEISFEEYLKHLHDNLSKIHILNNPSIIYFAKDIPIFHHFLFPSLAAFKIFFWSKTLIQLPEFKDHKFKLDEIDKSTLEMGKRVLNLYQKIPSVEIWNEETINSAMRQIEYYFTVGVIQNRADAIKLCDDFNSLLDHLNNQAEQGCKFLPGIQPCFTDNFKLYQNEVILGDNSICVTSESLKTVFLTFNVLSMMVSSEKDFCEKIENYLNTMMKKSTLISRDSEKERTRFFNIMHQKVNTTKDRIMHT